MAVAPTQPKPVLYGADQPTINADPMQQGTVQTDPLAGIPEQQAVAYGNATATPIDPNASLRGTQINSTPSANTQQTSGLVQQQAQQVAQGPGYTPYQPQDAQGSPYTSMADQWLQQAYGQVPNQQASGSLLNSAVSGIAPGVNLQMPSGYSQSGDTTAARSGYLGALQNLQGPDRSQLASQAFQLMQEQLAPQRQQAIQQVGQNAAKFGRIGAGLTTNDLTGLEQSNRRQDDWASRDLALQAAGQTLADRLGIAGAYQGGVNTLGGQDLAASGLNLNATNAGNQAQLQAAGYGLDRAGTLGNLASLGQNLGLQRGNYLSGLAGQAFGQGSQIRGENRTDQNNQFQQQQTQYGNALQGLNALSGLQGQQFGQDQTQLGNLLNERGYQDQLANDAQSQAIQQYLAEQAAQQQQFGQQQSILDQLYKGGYGSQGLTTNTLGDQAGQQQNYADQSAQGIQDMLYQLLLGQKQQPSGIVPAPQAPAGGWTSLIPKTP